MKIVALLVLVTASSTLVACGRAEPPSTSNMPDMPNRPAALEQPAENRGIGVVQSVDAVNGSLTIAHGPIAGLGWPAMTMAFKVSRPELLEAVEAGQRIEFTLQGRDMSAVVTAIEKASE